MLAAVKPDQAASGSAVSEAGTELGGALGIALLGSIGTAAYRAYAGDHLPADGSPRPGGGLAGRRVLRARDARCWPLSHRDAYVHGLHVAALAGAAVLLRGGPRAPAHRSSHHSAHCY